MTCRCCGAVCVCVCVFPDAAVSMELELLWPVFHPSPSRTESYHPLYPAGPCKACTARHALLLLPIGRNRRYRGGLPATEGLPQCLLSNRVGVAAVVVLGFLNWGGALVVINGPWSLPHYWASVLWAHSSHSSHPSHLLHLSHERGRELCIRRASGVCWERRSLLSLAAHAFFMPRFQPGVVRPPATRCGTYTYAAVGASLLRMVSRSLSDPLCSLERVCLVCLLLCRPVVASTCAPEGEAVYV